MVPPGSTRSALPHGLADGRGAGDAGARYLGSPLVRGPERSASRCGQTLPSSEPLLAALVGFASFLTSEMREGTAPKAVSVRLLAPTKPRAKIDASSMIRVSA